MGEHTLEIATAFVLRHLFKTLHFTRSGKKQQGLMSKCRKVGQALDVQGKDTIKKLFVLKMDEKMQAAGCIVYLTCYLSTAKETRFSLKSSTWQHTQSLMLFSFFLLFFTSSPHLVYYIYHSYLFFYGNIERAFICVSFLQSL